MNEMNMNDALKIVNRRVLRMLNTNEVNSELFFRDVRTLAELIEHNFEDDDNQEWVVD